MTVKTKLASNKGMSLGEVLVAVLILLLLTGIVAGGIPVAQNAYINVVDCGNAEVLISTSMTVMNSELGGAKEVKVDSAGNVKYFKSSVSGLWSKLENTDDGILITQYAGLVEEIGSTTPSNAYLIVSRKAATDPLHTEYDSVKYADGVFTVSGLRVVRNGETLTDVPVYMIVSLNDVAASE